MQGVKGFYEFNPREMNKKQLEMKANGVFATYTGHYRGFAEGSIFLAKEGACTINLRGAASMSQEELDEYGRKLAQALNQNEDEKRG